jgi:hypothetical protein
MFSRVTVSMMVSPSAIIPTACAVSTGVPRGILEVSETGWAFRLDGCEA